jgi:peptidoglycan/LPS O-acetylase OafA/YrhL
MAKFYIKSLDGLRGVAVLLVFLFHLGRLGLHTFGFEIGWIGVQLFFVLSGYLITRILLEQKNTDLSTYLKGFYWRRTLRIFPLYFGYLFLLVIAYFAVSIPANLPSFTGFLFTYTFNYSILFTGLEINRLFTHLWSLCVEEQFYMLWPFLIYFLSRGQIKTLIIILLFATPLFRFFFYEILTTKTTDPETIGTSIYWFTFSHFDAFAIGGGINFLKNRAVGLKPQSWVLVCIAICCVAGYFNYSSLSHTSAVAISSLGFPIHEIGNFQFTWSYSILNLLFASILWYFVHNESKILSSPIPVFLGRISYGIYVFHFPIMGLLSNKFGTILNEGVTILINLVLTIAVAWLSYYLFESRFLKLKPKD